MEWKQNVTIPTEEKAEKPGEITVCRLHENLILLLIDIRTYTIPEIIPAKERREIRDALYINYSTGGRCELSMRDGSATFLESGELAVDRGHVVQDNGSFYYPNQAYRGVEICFAPGESLDKALSLGSQHTAITDRFYRSYMEQDRLLITRPEERTAAAFEIMAEDVALDMPKEVLLMDVYRLLTLLGDLRFAEAARRTYYTDTQMKIAKLAMKELSENLSRRISAAELAAKFGVSESSLKNYFRGVYGKGYRESLHELRMKKAAELLEGDGILVSQAAAAVGYASQSRFAKAFREYFGVSPKEYSRRAHLNNQ